jgi:hypothetical protein
VDETAPVRNSKDTIKRRLDGAEKGKYHKEQHRNTDDGQIAWRDIFDRTICHAEQVIEHRVPLIRDSGAYKFHATIHHAHLAKDEQYEREQGHHSQKRIERQRCAIDHGAMHINATQRVVYQSITSAQAATLGGINAQKVVVYKSL